MMLHNGSHDRHGKVVHRLCSSCISNVRKSNRNSIEFSLSIAKQRVVGFIPAWSLAFLQVLGSESEREIQDKKNILTEAILASSFTYNGIT